MVATIFPFNPVLSNMMYHDSKLRLYFKSKLTTRTYRADTDEYQKIVWKLYHSKTGKDVVDTFNNEIKNKFEVLKVEIHGKKKSR